MFAIDGSGVVVSCSTVGTVAELADVVRLALLSKLGGGVAVVAVGTLESDNV